MQENNKPPIDIDAFLVALGGGKFSLIGKNGDKLIVRTDSLRAYLEEGWELRNQADDITALNVPEKPDLPLTDFDA